MYYYPRGMVYGYAHPEQQHGQQMYRAELFPSTATRVKDIGNGYKLFQWEQEKILRTNYTNYFLNAPSGSIIINAGYTCYTSIPLNILTNTVLSESTWTFLIQNPSMMDADIGFALMTKQLTVN